MDQVGDIARGLVAGLSMERTWDGTSTITEPGIWSGIPLEAYHTKTDLLDGPSVSKSMLKWIFPFHDGSPKAFWGRWQHNPNRIATKTTAALDFGRAVHCLLLGDEVFRDNFTVRPDTYPDSKTGAEKPWNANSNYCKDFLAEAASAGLTVLSSEQIERIRRISDDAAKYPLVKAGILNGRVERSLLAKDPKTGIWLRVRPDAMPSDGIFADLKTAGKLDEDFLERQMADAVYYLQGGMTKMVCDLLGIPFETFVLLYVLNDDVPDTAHVEIAQCDIERGERAIRWAFDAIRRGLDTGEWPGARPFNDGTRQLQMKPWDKTRMDNFLDMAGA